jgi:hypothetical protein
MASTYSDLKIELIGTGEQTGTWGTTTNDNFSIAIGEAITGSADVAFSSADVTLTLTNTNASQAARNLRLNLTGTSGGARQLILGSGCQIDKLYLINNGLADAVTVKNTTGTGIAVPAGKTMFVFNNGTNVVEATSGDIFGPASSTDNAVARFDGTTGKAIQNSVVTIADSTGDMAGVGTLSSGAITTTGVLTLPAGTVSAPAITTTGDTNTGIFFPAADTIAFTEGGVEAMRIDSSSNVGIGTSSPSSFFDGARNLVVGTGSGAQGMTIYAGTANSSNIFFADGTSTPAQYIGQIRYFHDNNYMMFVTNDGERMRIDSSGNVGVGTTTMYGKFNSTPKATYNANGTTWAETALSVQGAFGGGLSLIDGSAGYAFNVEGSGGTFVIKQGTVGSAANERMRIDSSGNVGIGSTAPVSLLEVKGSAPVLTINETGTTQTCKVSFYGRARGYETTSISTLEGGAVGAGMLAFSTNSGGSGNNTERMRITATGDVGIGTSSPDAVLTVNTIASFGDGAVGTPSIAHKGDLNTGFWFPSADTIAASTAGAERMRIDSSGNVGIGTSSPTTRLHIAGATTATSQLTTQHTGSAVTTIFGCDGGIDAGAVYVTTNHPLAFKTNNAERMRITDAGKVLIGTTTSGNTSERQFQVTNPVGTSGNQAIAAVLGANTNNTNSYLYIGFSDNADRFFVFGNGNVQNTNNSYGAISDIKVKENIVDATPKLDKLNQVRIVNFNLKGETTKQIGVVAQELETIFPSMIDESFDMDKEGNALGTTTKSVKYSVFVPMLIKAMQEQQALIENLTTRLNALESK